MSDHRRQADRRRDHRAGQLSAPAPEHTHPAADGRACSTPAFAWDWSAAALGALYALPGAIVILSALSSGLALVLGVLPAAIVGVIPTRRARPAIVALGLAVGAPMFLGGVLAGVPVLAVAAIAAFGVGAAWLAARIRFGWIVMTLSLPLFGCGLSYSDIGKAAAIGGLMVAGSVGACLISLCWPEPRRRPRGRRTRRPPFGTACVLGRPVQRQRRSGSPRISSTSAGRARPRCW